MKFGKKELFAAYILFTILFFAAFYLQILFLQKVVLGFFIFFLPGSLIVIFLDKFNILKFILYSIVVSISIVLFAIILLNIWFRIPFDTNFLYFLFLFTTLPQMLFLFFNRTVSLQTPKFSVNKWLLGIVVSAIIVETILFLKIGSLMGPDVGRFAILSHIYYIEKHIVTNLQPYDLAYKYFYFPGVTVLPTVFEIVGINAIDTLTLIGIIANLTTILAFYFFSKNLLGDYAVSATLFFAFLFNTPLYFILFAFQPFGMSYLFLFTSFSILLMHFFNKSERNFIVFSFALLGILFFHPYIVFLFFAFIGALLIYDFIENGNKLPNFLRMLKFSLPALLISIALFLPYLIYFRDGIYASFTRLNKIDILSYKSLYLFSFIPVESIRQILVVLFSLPVGFIDPVYLVIAFIIFIVSLKKFIHGEKKILAIFFLLTIGMNYFSTNNINLSRFLTSTSIFYPAAMPSVLNYMPLNALFVGGSVFFNSPSSLFYLKNLNPIVDPGSPFKTVVWPEFNDAVNFIRENTSLNSTFLVDGGGAGCLGLSSSYGERIFPLTSRKIFYFTNYCWAEYNRTDYSSRVDLYRKIAENPSDTQSVQILKNYGVTHVYIGPDDFILKSAMFLNSSYYKEIFHENKIYIFQLN